jgi:hypothetical protein
VGLVERRLHRHVVDARGEDAFEIIVRLAHGGARRRGL